MVRKRPPEEEEEERQPTWGLVPARQSQLTDHYIPICFTDETGGGEERQRRNRDEHSIAVLMLKTSHGFRKFNNPWMTL